MKEGPYLDIKLSCLLNQRNQRMDPFSEQQNPTKPSKNISVNKPSGKAKNGAGVWDQPSWIFKICAAAGDAPLVLSALSKKCPIFIGFYS